MQQRIDIFEPLFGGQGVVEHAARFGLAVPELREQQERVLHHIVFDQVAA